MPKSNFCHFSAYFWPIFRSAVFFGPVEGRLFTTLDLTTSRELLTHEFPHRSDLPEESWNHFKDLISHSAPKPHSAAPELLEVHKRLSSAFYPGKQGQEEFNNPLSRGLASPFRCPLSACQSLPLKVFLDCMHFKYFCNCSVKLMCSRDRFCVMAIARKMLGGASGAAGGTEKRKLILVRDSSVTDILCNSKVHSPKNRIGNGQHTVSRVLLRKREVTEFLGQTR